MLWRRERIFVGRGVARVEVGRRERVVKVSCVCGLVRVAAASRCIYKSLLRL